MADNQPTNEQWVPTRGVGEPCPVDDCGKPIRCRGLCKAHYTKLNRYGTPTPVHDRAKHDLSGRRFGDLVARTRIGDSWICDCDCGGVHTVRTGHLSAGSVTRCSAGDHPSESVVGYVAAHNRVRRLRGRAHEHQCCDCGSPATEWSYMHNDPSELISDQGTSAGCLYSLNPDCYAPRCRRCHRRFDLVHGNASNRKLRSHCKHGHLLVAENVYSDRACKSCRKARARMQYRRDEGDFLTVANTFYAEIMRGAA